jgi:Domain of unknown function (DUF4124)
MVSAEGDAEDDAIHKGESAMSKVQFQACGRSMRWYEWVLMLAMLGLAAGARADSVYKCSDAQGSIAFQAQPCPPHQDETQVDILPAPPHAASPDYAVVDKKPMPHVHSEHGGGHVAARPTQVSYECRVANGEVFYRHSACPHSVPANVAASGRNRSGSGGKAVTQKLTVSSHPLPREEACAQIHRAGAIGRAYRTHDEDVSTYDRNLGRDPCR